MTITTEVVNDDIMDELSELILGDNFPTLCIQLITGGYLEFKLWECGTSVEGESILYILHIPTNRQYFIPVSSIVYWNIR